MDVYPLSSQIYGMKMFKTKNKKSYILLEINIQYQYLEPQFLVWHFEVFYRK